MTPQQEVNAALRFLESRGHTIGIAHLPPAYIGTNIRVWVDEASRSLDEVLRMAKDEGMTLPT